MRRRRNICSNLLQENRVKARLDCAAQKMHLNFYGLHEYLLRFGACPGKGHL